jgi:hypothetical protein
VTPAEAAAVTPAEAAAVAELGPARGKRALKLLVNQSKQFNREGRKQTGPYALDAEAEALLGPERAEKFRALAAARAAREKKTRTAGGAFIASQVNSKEKIGATAAYTTPEQRDGHLGEFMKGAHAFVSNDAYLKITGRHLTEANFNAWGSDSNFVAPLAEADALVKLAAGPDGRGLFQLEQELGIPPSSWVNQCKSSDYAIWRFKILKPQVLNIRIPAGSEYGAYGSWVDKEGNAHRGEWRPNGQTLGGAREAVIDKVGAGKYGASGEEAGLETRNQLAKLQADGVLEIVLDTSMSENTKKVLAAKATPA